MPGGSAESYAVLGPMFESVSAKVDGEPCSTHIGTDGAGHFVKMVHNGIEYADMQLIAEAYDLLRQVGGYSPAEIAEIFRRWNEGRLGSYLIEITAEVLAHTDAETGKAFVDVVTDAAGQKGTGRWTVQTALELGSPVTAIAQATFARASSSQGSLRAAYRGLPGGTTPPLSRTEADRFTAQVEQALYASKVIAYDQGWKMIQDAAAEFDWSIDLAAVAGIWRGGCIIRASFLDRIRAAYTADPGLVSLLSEESFAGRSATRRSRGARSSPRRRAAAFRSRRSPPRCPTTTRCAPTGRRRPCSRASATSSARTPTAAPTAPARSTRTGPAPAARRRRPEQLR